MVGAGPHSGRVVIGSSSCSTRRDEDEDAISGDGASLAVLGAVDTGVSGRDGTSRSTMAKGRATGWLSDAKSSFLEGDLGDLESSEKRGRAGVRRFFFSGE